MTDLSTNPVQSNIMVQALLEALFNAELSCTEQGCIPRTAEGIQLEEFQFASMWITYNKLVKDIHQIVGKQVWPIINPDLGCKLRIRDIDTQVVDGKNYTSFIFAVDPLGYDVGLLGYNEAPVEVKPVAYFSPEDVVIGMIESTGTHTINVAENEIPKDRNGKELRVIETSFAWYGITELQTRASQFIFGLANAYEQSATIYILDHKTAYHDQPNRNVTSLKYAIAHPEF